MRETVVFWIHLLVFLLCGVMCAPTLSPVPSYTPLPFSTGPVGKDSSGLLLEVNTTLMLGSTPVIVCQQWNPNIDVRSLSFINVHQNENTSIIAARTHLFTHGGNFTFLIHGNTREVFFNLSNETYVFDPNRCFTPVGANASLALYGRTSPAALNITVAFGQQLLKLYGFEEQSVITALHNNSPRYSAADYLAGGEFAGEASKVNIVNGTNPRMFFYTTSSNIYDSLVDAEFNALLQVSNASSIDDGSLSVWAAMRGKDYTNIEAAAACCFDGGRMIYQYYMITRYAELLGGHGNGLQSWLWLTGLLGLVAGVIATALVAIVISKRRTRSYDQL